MIVEVLKNETFIDQESLPHKGTEKSTGYDIIATSDPIFVGDSDGLPDNVTNNSYIEYKTNLRIAVQSEKLVTNINNTVNVNYDTLAFPRSSIRKYNLLLANSIGLIDQDYRGEVIICFKYIWQPEDFVVTKNGKITGVPNFKKMYKKGDKICQLKVTKCENVKFSLVNELDKTNRGDGGFGSTDENDKIQKAKQHMSAIEELYNNIADTSDIPKKYSESIKEREIN
jgi:dUTP pyrophosphatase|tara:strand:- start:2121 stop:2801 length:681 start_codon:yes stop_codon:yes gene_type:complete